MDDVDETNGPMDVLSFSACPESRDKNVPTSFIKDSGGSTKAFDNFNLSLDEKHLKPELKRRVCIKRGEVEWHSAYTVHRSDPNLGDRRRMAFIVRYIPTGTRVVSNVRGSFDEDYFLMPVAGKGA